MRASGPASTARDRVDSSRGVLLLDAEHTKRKRRREVPMRQAVYDVLAALPGPREGRVWPSDDIRTSFENAKLGDFHFHTCAIAVCLLVRHQKIEMTRKK
jgi:hypothetical protein